MEKFDWKELEKGFVALAPMAGVADSAFRRVCKKLGADIVVTEFVHVRGVANRDERTLSLLRYHESERPIVVQLFGHEPEYFTTAAKIVEGLGFDGVDINMGCPARKVVGHGSGASLMKDSKLAQDIVKATKEGTSLPVSVKTRLGYESFSGTDFIQGLEQAGAELITIHGRTFRQGFTGKADYDAIKEVVASVDVPVIGNGDVVDLESYKKIMETGCDGVMIGRGSYGNPWVFEEIKKGERRKLSTSEVVETVLGHARWADEQGGNSILELRKHLGWYFKGFPGVKELRQRLVQVETYQDIEKILSNL